MKRESAENSPSKRQRHFELKYSYNMPVIVSVDELKRIIDAGPHTFDSIKQHVPTLHKLSQGFAYYAALRQERSELTAKYWAFETSDRAPEIIEAVEDPIIRSALWLELGQQAFADEHLDKARAALSKSGSSQALFELARLDAKVGDRKHYLEKLQAASQSRQDAPMDGSTDATFYLARSFAYGYKTYVNKKVAWSCYLDAVSRGHCGAMLGLAQELEWGTNGLFSELQCRYDAVLAFELVKIAATTSDKAGIHLARMYADGVGVRRDLNAAKTAIKLVQNRGFHHVDIETRAIARLDPFTNKACPKKLVEHLQALNTAGSKQQLAYLYRYGIGVEQDDAKSTQWLINAPEKIRASLAKIEVKELAPGRTVRVYRDIDDVLCLRVHADTLSMPELESVLQFAEDNWVENLYLNGLNLEALPDREWKFFKLVDLRNNNLRTFPPSFKQQKHLKTLLLSGNNWDTSYEADVLHLMLEAVELREVDVDAGSPQFLASVEFLCLQRARNREFTEQVLARN